MIPYRLLPPAEEEMTEAALFYEKAAAGLGDDFLDDVQVAIDSVRDHPELGESVTDGFRRVLLRRFPFSIYLCCGELVDCGGRRRPSTASSRVLEKSRMTASTSSSGRVAGGAGRRRSTNRWLAGGAASYDGDLNRHGWFIVESRLSRNRHGRPIGELRPPTVPSSPALAAR